MASTTKIYKVRKPTPGIKSNGDIVDKFGDLPCVDCGSVLEVNEAGAMCPGGCREPFGECWTHISMIPSEEDHPTKGEHKGPFSECAKCVNAVVGKVVLIPDRDPGFPPRCPACGDEWSNQKDYLAHWKRRHGKVA